MTNTNLLRWAGALVLLGACDAEPDPIVVTDGPLPLQAGDDAYRLAGNTDLYWVGNPVMIPVCWETDTPDSTARAWVREAVESGWGRFARVNFTGWGWCTSPSQSGVHVRNLEQAVAAGELPSTAPSNANASGASQSGRYLDGVADGVTLGFCNGASDRESCVKAIALHEFGHVLGFYHAEERSDYTGPMCGSVDFPNPNEQLFGAYDIESVMSYCGGGGSRLSAGDIAAAQRVYGRRSAGTLMSARANCLSANQYNPGNPGDAAFLWDCAEDYDNQEWRYRPASGRLEIKPGFPGSNTACMSMWGNTDVATAEDCSGSVAQRFSFQNVELRGFGGKCLDLQGGNTASGTPVQLWDCFSDRDPAVFNRNQRWDVVSQGNGLVEIRFADDPTRCVTAAAWGTSNGTELHLASCIYPTAQGFQLGGDGSIRYSHAGVTKCWDAAGVADWQFTQGQGGPYDGARLQLWSCSLPTLNQKWNISGQLRSTVNPTQCLDRQWSQDGNGVIAWSWNCAENNPLGPEHAQVWDYYPLP